jgi:hypothetical protein
LNIPQNWKDDGQTLAAPIGSKVVLGFRQYVLANNECLDPKRASQNSDYLVILLLPNEIGLKIYYFMLYVKMRYYDTL